jgi:quinol monooxygenase YgiN
MSVLVVVDVTGDTMTFQKALADRADEFVAVSDRAKEMGAIHHRFGIGDGHIVAVDEWETAEAFQAFFGDPKMQEFVGSIGAEAGPPQITITEAIPSPDEF